MRWNNPILEVWSMTHVLTLSSQNSHPGTVPKVKHLPKLSLDLPKRPNVHNPTSRANTLTVLLNLRGSKFSFLHTSAKGKGTTTPPLTTIWRVSLSPPIWLIHKPPKKVLSPSSFYTEVMQDFFSPTPSAQAWSHQLSRGRASGIAPSRAQPNSLSPPPPPPLCLSKKKKNPPKHFSGGKERTKRHPSPSYSHQPRSLDEEYSLSNILIATYIPLRINKPELYKNILPFSRL